MAKRNLQESQSKMKVWYDRKWLRKLVTQITWSKLLVQVCHINMLKAYHEKPKPELVTLSCTVLRYANIRKGKCSSQVFRLPFTKVANI